MGGTVSTPAAGGTTPMQLGIIGCGTIVGAYLETLPRLPLVKLVAVADLDPRRAQAVADREPGVRALTVDELLADPGVDTVLNLTIPAAHAEVDLAAIAAGKNVYAEKPFAVTDADGRAVLEAARTASVHVGSAPDTVLGTGIQTARAAIDAGRIGTPVAATATMITAGHERWHAQPDFYYRAGGGPLLDMGPYYVHALVTLLGPVRSVLGASRRSRDTRTIGTGPRAGEVIPVEVDTYVTGILVHESGVLSTLVMGFDGAGTTAHPIEVHGTAGTLGVPDPNLFDGDVRLLVEGSDWEVLPVSAGYVDAGRGIGLQDMAAGIARSEGFRASGELGQHALEVMNGVLEAARGAGMVEVETGCGRSQGVRWGKGDSDGIGH